MTTPSHIEILAALRQWSPIFRTHFTLEERRGFRLAVGEVCSAIEKEAAPHDLWTSPEFHRNPEGSRRIGDHISATRQAFDILP